MFKATKIDQAGTPKCNILNTFNAYEIYKKYNDIFFI